MARQVPSILGVIAVLLVTVAAAGIAIARPTAIRECGTIAPSDATDAAAFDHLWRLDRNGSGWTGGDGVFCVPLHGGRVAWLFGDSFIGGVRADGRRSSHSRLVRNAVVVQQGRCLTTVVGGTRTSPQALIRPAAPGEWYWPQDGLATRRTLQIAALRVLRTGPGDWDFAVAGVDVVDLAVRSLRVTAIHALPVDGTVLWGSSVLRRTGTTYVYGVENTPVDARVFLARTAGRSLAGRWRFYAGPGRWSRDPRTAAALTWLPRHGQGPPAPLTGVSSGVTAAPDADGVGLVTQAPGFGTAVTLRHARSPEGPFGPPRVIATAAAPAGAFTYGARVHPDLCAPGLQLLSWNVGSATGILHDASLYRPRFLAIPWASP